MALMCRANGVSQIRETIFENRFMHVSELAQLGGYISVSGDLAKTAAFRGFGAPR